MLPLFSAPFDANGSVLVPGRPGSPEPADVRPHSTSDPGLDGGAAAAAGVSVLALAQWTAFARSLRVAHDSVYDVVRAVGLDASLAHAVAEQVAALGSDAVESQPDRTPVDPAAKLALVFDGVTVSFAGSTGSFQLSVDQVSVKASAGAGAEAGFGEARFSFREAGDGRSVDAQDSTLEARVKELGVSVAGEVAVDRLPTGEVSAKSVSQLRFDLAVPLAASGEPGTHPVNVTV